MSTDLLLGFTINRWPLLPLRLMVGFGFMERGSAKLAKGPDAFANILQAMGVPEPHFMAWDHHTGRNTGCFNTNSARFRNAGQRTDGRGSFGSHVHRTPALRIQLDQAPGGDCSRCAVRSAGL